MYVYDHEGVMIYL